MTYKEIFKLVTERLAETFVSVKVWFFVWPFVVSTILLYYFVHLNLELTTSIITVDQQSAAPLVKDFGVLIMDTFKSWLTFNISLVSVIIVAREVWKINKLRSDKENE